MRIFYRDALHDLDEVAGGVLWWKQGEVRTRPSLKTIDMAEQRAVRESVDMDCDRLPDMHMRQLRLLEIGNDIDLVRDRGKQGLTRLHEVTHLHAAAGDRPCRRGINLGV
jgi:hypothetical protein